MQADLADQRFQDLYRTYQRQVLAYFLRRTDATAARDGAANTFLVAWRRIDDIPAGDNALPWLYGVARRVLANQRRSRDRYAALSKKLTRVGPAAYPSAEVIVLRRTEDKELLDAVAHLRPEDQEVIRLAVWEELPHAQIGELIGTSAHAVTQRLHRITKQLARDLQRPSIGRLRRAMPGSDAGGDRR